MSFSSKVKSFVLGLFFDFFVFCSFVSRLESSLRKNHLCSSKLVLTQFGYPGFPFFVVFSRLALVSLDNYIILFKTG